MPLGGLRYRKWNRAQKWNRARSVIVGLLILAALAVVAIAVYSFATGV